MATILPIVALGHQALRETAQPVTLPLSADLQDLIDNMLHTLQDAGGVGIAATQVAINAAIIIVASHPNPRYPEAPHMLPMPMVNPEIIEASDEEVLDWEGCLSIPGIRGLVPRATEVTVRYFDRSGARHEIELEGFIARVFLHEFDHLNGMVFLDRVRDNRDIIAESEYINRMQSPDPDQRA